MRGILRKILGSSATAGQTFGATYDECEEAVLKLASATMVFLEVEGQAFNLVAEVNADDEQ